MLFLGTLFEAGRGDPAEPVSVQLHALGDHVYASPVLHRICTCAPKSPGRRTQARGAQCRCLSSCHILRHSLTMESHGRSVALMEIVPIDVYEMVRFRLDFAMLHNSVNGQAAATRCGVDPAVQPAGVLGRHPLPWTSPFCAV